MNVKKSEVNRNRGCVLPRRNLKFQLMVKGKGIRGKGMRGKGMRGGERGWERGGMGGG